MIKSISNANLPEAGHLSTSDVAKWNYAPRTDWAQMGAMEHFVQFYEADGFLLNSLSGFTPPQTSIAVLLREQDPSPAIPRLQSISQAIQALRAYS